MSVADWLMLVLGVSIAVFIPGALNIWLHRRHPRAQTQRFKRLSFLGAFLGELLWIFGTAFYAAASESSAQAPVELSLVAGFIGALLLTRLFLSLNSRRKK